MSHKLFRGAVVTVRLDPSEGREIRKTRPAVVVSNDVACRFDAVVQVVPLTRLPDRELRPYESRIDSKSSGLTKPSRSVANQARTVSKARIGDILGRLTDEEGQSLDRALRIQLGLQTARHHLAATPSRPPSPPKRLDPPPRTGAP